MPTLLIRNADLIEMFDDRRRRLYRGYVAVEGPTIVDIGEEPCRWTGDEVVDAKGKLVLPGFINLHHHFFQSLTRAVPSGSRSAILEWLRNMYLLWAELDEEAVHAAAQVAAAELLLTGCTTSVDFAYLHPRGQEALLEAELEAVRQLGLRLHAVRGCTPVLEANVAQELASFPGMDPGLLIEDEATSLAASERAIARFHDASRYAMCRIGVGPTTVAYDRPEFMRALRNVAAEAGAGCHLHLHPRPDEVSTCQRLHGVRPVRFLDQVGWSGPGVWFAHGSQYSDEDIECLAASGTGVAHCPSCLMRLGFPVARIPRMHARAVPLGIGVDGSASNDSSSMLGELRLALLIHRIAGVHPDLPPENWLQPADVLWMATRGGAAILGRDDLGSLEAGKAADMVLIDLGMVGYAGALHDPLGALLLAGYGGPVHTTIVNGCVVVRDGSLVNADQRSIARNGNLAAARLVRRAQTRTGVDFGSDLPRLAQLAEA